MTSFLFEDLVIGILLRLPVKSLLRFESLSKSWYAIITSRNFRYQHLNDNRAGGCLWVQYYRSRCSRIANVYLPDETLSDLTRHAVKIPNISEIIHGPVNGIFLVTCAQYLYALWNPATKEYRELPDPGFRWYCYAEYCGFGLDPITKDYKVVLLQDIEHPNISLVGKVHTLGTEHWNDLNLDWAPVEALYTPTCHTYLDGVYYFQFSYSKVLSFDMATDAIDVIPPPNELEPINASYGASGTISSFQGTIALFHIQHENYLRVWMLKEKSWIKHFTVGLQTQVKHVIACWKDEILLHSYADRFLLYKPTTREIQDIGFHPFYSCIGIHAYKESLISIEEEYEYRRQRDLQT